MPCSFCDGAGFLLEDEYPPPPRGSGPVGEGGIRAYYVIVDDVEAIDFNFDFWDSDRMANEARLQTMRSEWETPRWRSVPFVQDCWIRVTESRRFVRILNIPMRREGLKRLADSEHSEDYVKVLLNDANGILPAQLAKVSIQVPVNGLAGFR